MEPSVTVVIPAYKAAVTLGRAIGSVCAQPGISCELIIVLDGPDEAARAVVTAIAPDAVVIVHPQNRGVQAARTSGLDAARGDFVMFLDADDFLEGDLIGAGAAAMTKSAADIGFATMDVRDEAGGQLRTIRLNPADPSALFAGWLGDNRFVAPCAVLWRTAFLRRIGGWDLDLHRQEDGEAVLRGLLMGARVCALPESRAVYVQHRGPDRLTGQSANMRSLLDVPAKLLAIDSTAIPAGTVRRAAAKSYANAARALALRGLPALAAEARARAAALGGARPVADPPFAFIYRWLPFPLAIATERCVRAVSRRPY